MNVLAWPAFDYEPDSFNPYNWLLNKNLENEGINIIPFSLKNILTKKYAIWHMHWPAENVLKGKNAETYLRFVAFFLLVLLAKIKGSKIVWTAHNYELHDSKNPTLELFFWNFFIPVIDGYISHSEYAEKVLLQHHPNLSAAPSFVIPHGHYRGWYKNRVTKKEARKKLDIPPDSSVCLFIGTIRKYKRLDKLIERFNEISDQNYYLIIAGKPGREIEQNVLESKIKANKNIKYYPKWIDKDDLQFYFNASNIVVLPYKKIINSGMALLAISFKVPILIPEIPTMIEYQDLIGREAINVYKGTLNKEKLSTAIENAKRNKENLEFDISKLGWDNIAKQTKEAYENIVG